MLKSAIIIVFVFCTVAVFAAVADTNVVTKSGEIATFGKCQQTAAANVGTMTCVVPVAASVELKAELKEAIVDAKAEYKDRYDELKGAHDRFMDQLNISLWVITALIALCSVVVPIIGFVLQWRSVKKTDEERRKFEKLNETNLELRRSRIASSMIMMHFTWTEFFNANKNGQVKNGEILLPLYRMIEPLLLANKLGEVQLLNDCLEGIAEIVGKYAEKVGPMDDVRFKEFIRQNRYFADALPCNLAETLGGKTGSLVTVLKFLKEFGITMFGEVDG